MIFWSIPYALCLITLFFPLSHYPYHSKQPLLQYLIFPAQFAYLYSYHPTGNMENLPSMLEKVWKARHFEGAEQAFQNVADGKKIESSGPSFFKNVEIEKAPVVP
jgi:zeaxanthin epoxidase